jgi:UDP-N-acetyl-2-amino-2-deoxyglucuronate dehydrogenase
MRSRKVGMAMIGCGGIAQAHLKAIAKIPDAELIAVMDAVERKAQAAADEYGGRLYRSIDAILGDEDVDAVVLPLPHHLHCPVTIQAAEAGKHVLVEKPMAMDLPESRRMVDAADAAGVRLMVGQSTRFYPEVWAAKNLIRDGRIGQMQQCLYQRTFYRVKWVTRENRDDYWRYSAEQCSGVYLPLFGSHDVDMILWLMDAAPVRVSSMLRSYLDSADAESSGAINMELTGNKIASLAFSMTSQTQQLIKLFVGTEGALLIEGNKLLVNNEEIQVDRSERTFTRQMREFVNAILTDREPVPSGRDALATMAILDAAKESSATGRVVEVEI